MPARAPAEAWNITLKTLSPTFIGGASSRTGPAILRGSAVRGALRAWYRMLVGPATAAGLLPEHRHLAESHLFGGIGDRDGQSAVLISVRHEGSDPCHGSCEWPSTLDAPRGYLGYTFRFRGNNRKSYRAGHRFGLRLTLRPGLPETSRALLEASLALWITFGGLGLRSRRGFGSVGEAGPATACPLGAPEGKLPLLLLGDPRLSPEKVLKTAQTLVKHLPSLKHGAHPDPAYFLGLGQAEEDRARFLLVDPYGKSWSDALDQLGRTFRDFRAQAGVDGLTQPLLSCLRDGKLPRPPARAAFGLPLSVQRRNRKPDDPTYILVPSGPGFGPRAPSPLLFSLVESHQGPGLALAVTLLAGPQPGRDLAVAFGHNGQKITVKPNPALDLPSRFLAQFPKGSEITP